MIIPVYNMQTYMNACLESLLSQRLGDYSLEIIAVDDGSTDGSGALLDQLADKDTRLTVIHQANSGWPGQPRNRGIELSSGRYIFFCDADDIVPEESLRRLIDFADTNESDVVIPRVVGGNGRWIRSRLYEQTEIDADLFKAFQTHGPQKLFRRSMVIEHNIRFPEYKMRIEDAMFGFRCYTCARRVSILADYDYYILQNRNDGSNISRTGLDPDSYTADSIDVARVIYEGVPAGNLRDRILVELYRRLCLRRYVGSSFVNTSRQRQDSWISGHQAFIHEFIAPSLDALLDPVQRQRSALIRQGRRDDLVTMAVSTAADSLEAEMISILPSAIKCTIFGNVRIGNQFRSIESGVLELRKRGHNEVSYFSIHPEQFSIQEGMVSDSPRYIDFEVQLHNDVLTYYSPGTYDVFFRTMLDGKSMQSRVKAPSGHTVIHYPGNERVHFYATKHGNLSANIQSIPLN